MQIFIQALGNHGITDEHVRERIAVLSERLTAEARRITGNGVTFSNCFPAFAKLSKPWTVIRVIALHS